MTNLNQLFKFRRFVRRALVILRLVLLVCEILRRFFEDSISRAYQVRTKALRIQRL
ncbi:MAG: hypothetical protein RJB66_2472 [Pseudomonadota bacterium]|jgi:uncharacterized membrane protein affecting hemolysin expression